MTVTEATMRTLDAPGATITYDVRPGGDGSQPPLMLIGSPMGAAGFVTLSSHFPERTVVTYDPRGAERSAQGRSEPPSRFPNNMPTTFIGSSRRSADRWICSLAAVAR